MKKDNNKITVKSYLFLIGLFIIMSIFFINSIITFDIPLIILFTLSSLILGLFIIVLEPKKNIKFKYGDKVLLNLGKGE